MDGLHTEPPPSDVIFFTLLSYPGTAFTLNSEDSPSFISFSIPPMVVSTTLFHTPIPPVNSRTGMIYDEIVPICPRQTATRKTEDKTRTLNSTRDRDAIAGGNGSYCTRQLVPRTRSQTFPCNRQNFNVLLPGLQDSDSLLSLQHHLSLTASLMMAMTTCRLAQISHNDSRSVFPFQSKIFFSTS